MRNTGPLLVKGAFHGTCFFTALLLLANEKKIKSTCVFHFYDACENTHGLLTYRGHSGAAVRHFRAKSGAISNT